MASLSSCALQCHNSQSKLLQDLISGGKNLSFPWDMPPDSLSRNTHRIYQCALHIMQDRLTLSLTVCQTHSKSVKPSTLSSEAVAWQLILYERPILKLYISQPPLDLSVSGSVPAMTVVITLTMYCLQLSKYLKYVYDYLHAYGK